MGSVAAYLVENPRSTRAAVPALAVLFLLAIVVFHVALAFAGKAIFRASYLGTALEYAKRPLDLLRPVIVGFNALGTPTVQELPLWQAAAGAVMKLAHSNWYGWANVVSLLLFITGLYPFHQLARQYLSPRAAAWALVFFLAQPLIVVFAGEGSPDGLALVISLWFLYCADKMVRTEKAGWWIPTACVGSVAAITKLPFFMAAGLCSLCLLFGNRIRSVRAWVLLATAGITAGLVFAAWTAYADSVSAQAEFPYVELRLSESPFIRYWYFGDLHYRLTLSHWVKGGWRFLHATLGCLPMVAILLPAFFWRGNWMPKAWLATTFLTTLVFTHLVLEHWHYYLMCCPAVAMLCGVTLERLEEFWPAHVRPPWAGAALTGAALFLSAVSGVLAMRIAIDLDYFPESVAREIASHTAPGDKLLVYQADPNWGGEVLFRSQRRGLMVMELDKTPLPPSPKPLFAILRNADDLARLKRLGYNKLVLISESPVRYAVEASNPGSRRARRLYPEKISPAVDTWPVVFKSADMVIKEIP